MEKPVLLLVVSMSELGMLLYHLVFMLEIDRVVHQANLKNQMIQFFKDLIKIMKSVVCLVLILSSLNLTLTVVGFKHIPLTVYTHIFTNVYVNKDNTIFEHLTFVYIAIHLDKFHCCLL